MQSFRGILELWNEVGLVSTGLMSIGYFGIRGWLGWLPSLLMIGVIMGAIAIAWMLTRPPEQVEEEGFYSEQPQNRSFDQFMLYLGLFICAALVFAFVGSQL